MSGLFSCKLLLLGVPETLGRGKVASGKESADHSGWRKVAPTRASSRPVPRSSTRAPGMKILSGAYFSVDSHEGACS